MAVLHFCLSLPIPLIVFVLSTLPIINFYAFRAILKHVRETKKLHESIGCVPATVVRVGVDEQNWRDGWIVTAAWVDKHSKQTYTFQSRPQELPPSQKVGDQVLVFINSTNPLQYSMQL